MHLIYRFQNNYQFEICYFIFYQFYLQVVDGKLFTGSFDGKMKIWDTGGIVDETNFGKEDKEKEKQKKQLDKNQNGIENEKIMIDQNLL